MLTISRALGQSIESHFQSATSGGRDCRLLVPGLTDAISHEVHEYLLKQGVKSYLVVGQNEQPSASEKLIRAVGLTSKRIGSFVAISSPGQLAHIQDSIRGSGGTIRSVAFSEEWPWIDNGNEAFRFDGPVIDRLVSVWSADECEQQWLRKFVLQGLVEHTKPYSARAKILLEVIIGTFDPASYPDIPGVREKMLYHAGIPRPAAGAFPEPEKLIERSARLCRRVLEQCQKDEDVREQARNTLLDVVPEKDRRSVSQALDVFMDGVGQSSIGDVGLIAFHDCWGRDRKNYTGHWRCLTADRLTDLFDVKERGKVEVAYEVSCPRALISDEHTKIATFFGEQIRLEITSTIPGDQYRAGIWKVQVRNRSRGITERVLDGADGVVVLHIDTADADAIPNYSRKIPLKIVLMCGDDARVDEKLELHLCGPERPAFVVVDAPFDVIDATDGDDEETRDNKINLPDASHVHLFSEDKNVCMSDQEDEEINLIDTDHIGIWRSMNRIDPGAEPSGQMTRVCRFGKLSAVICFEARDIDKGEFTIEEEMRVLIAGPAGKRLKDLAGLFRGTNCEYYRALGKIDDAARRRSVLAKVMTTDFGWRPLLADLLEPNRYESDSLGSYVNCLGAVEEDALRALTLPNEAASLLKTYSSARKAVITAVETVPGLKPPTAEHPIYASHPMFVAKYASQREELLTEYLASYVSILEYVEKAQDELAWDQLLVLVHLDCVVHWGNGLLRNAFFLIGPWHPLVVAKRFMVQAALSSRAERIDKEDGNSFRKLSTLLGQVQGFRWVLGLSGEDESLEAACAMITSDPGWHLALKAALLQPGAGKTPGDLGEVSSAIWRNWGLTTEADLTGHQPLAVTVLTNYLQAFPSRRSLGVRIKNGYADTHIVESIDSYLHGEDSPTCHGKQLPGGIRLYLESTLPEDVEARWSDPPLTVYTFDDDEECVKQGRPDIYMLSPAQADAVKPEARTYELPRGQGYQAVFSEPLRWLTRGNSLVPRSVVYEFDVRGQAEAGLGGAFTKALGQIGALFSNPVVSVSRPDLPQRLTAPWVVIPGRSIDPGILVQYVREGADKGLQERTLWDYKLDVTGSAQSFFVLSTIPRGFQVAVNGFFEREDLAEGLVVELGRIGIAVGGEALKSGRRSLGVIGLVGAVRLLTGKTNEGCTPILCGTRAIGFLLPVDSFASFFGKNDPDNGKRTDLLAVQLALPDDDNGTLRIAACGIESKFTSGTFSSARTHEALEQANATTREFDNLVRASLREGAMPERLGLMELLRFGLRITAPSQLDEMVSRLDAEKLVYKLVLSGNYECTAAKYGAAVVSTEGGLPGVAEAVVLEEGIWARLTKKHWPGIAETEKVEQVRRLFCTLFENLQSSSFASSPSEVKSETSPSGKKADTNSKSEPLGEPVSPAVQAPNVAAKTSTSGPLETRALEAALQGVLIGVDESRRMARFDPQSPIDPLDNMNMMVTGSSGTGKTQFLKYLICKLREQGRNVLVLDLKNDFASDRVFCEKAGLERVFVSFDGLPYNPLIPYPVVHPATGNRFMQCAQHIAGVSSVLKRTYGLGPQQQVAVKNAIVAAFNSKGIQTTGSVPYTDELQFPDFANVGALLQNDNPSAYNRLDPLFTLDLFRGTHRNASFQSLVAKAVVLDLSQIPSDEIKNALAQLIVLSAHSYYNAQPHSGSIRQFLLFDEGHRVLASEYMSRLVRECRAYGVGVILSSQYLSDFPSEISASMATKVVHGNGRDAERVKQIVQMLGCEGREGDVASLGRFQAFLDSRHYPHTLLRTMNYPLYLVWSELRRRGTATRDDLARLEGIDPSKLPIGNLVHQLELLGLAEEKEGRVEVAAK